MGSSGNLFVISSLEDSIAEFTPLGVFVQMHDLPAGVDNLSGIALDCDKNEAWVVNTNGAIFHLGQFPCNTTGINDHQESFAISVYPNPSSGIFRFTNKIHDFSIYNSVGELVFQQVKPAETIDISAFPNGIYLFRMENGSPVKLIKYYTFIFFE